MSFFNKLDNSYENITLISSITQQIALIFSNRCDEYYAYDFKNRKIIPIHETFKMDYLDPAFADSLSQAIEVMDERTKNIKIHIKKTDTKIIAQIEGEAKSADEYIQLPQLIFELT